MARRNRRRKPAEPEAIREMKRERARAYEDARMRDDGIDPKIARWGDDEVTPEREAELRAKGVDVDLDHRRRMKSANVKDVWEEMATGKWQSISRDELAAVRRLQDLMLIRAGFGGRNEAKAYEDQKPDEPLRDPCLVTETMLAAAEEVELTLELVGPPSAAVLAALLDPLAMPASRRTDIEVTEKRNGETVTRTESIVVEDWRAAVARATGCKRPEAQGEMLKQAAKALVTVAPKVAFRLKRGAYAGDVVPTGEVKRTHPFGQVMA